MASSSGLINLDSLLTSKDNQEFGPIIKISHAVDSQSDREVESAGSDSSYGEFAKARARDMDRLISEARIEQEEKNKRITAARNQKAKEQEEKQKAFGKSSKKLPGKKSFFSKSLDGESIRKVKDNKSYKQIAKDAESVDNRSEFNNKIKRPRSKKTPLPPENKPRSLKIILPPKPKNITVQNYDIDSTPSSSSEEIDLQVVDSYQKSFKVKSLNRVVKEVDSCSSEDSDDENSQPIKQKFHHTAEKSAAAQRRKRSNYLKKRHANFKPNKTDNQKSDTNPDKKDIVSAEPILRDKPLNPHRDKKFKKDSTRQNQQAKTSTIDSPDQKSNRNTSSKKSQRKDGNGHTSKINDQELNTDKTCCSKDLTVEKLKNSNGKNKLTGNTVMNQGKNNNKKETKIIKKDFYPNSSSEDSIIVLKQVEENPGKNDDESFRQFEKSLFPSDNEIDWKSIEETHTKNTISQLIDNSDEDIDFNELIESRKAKTSSNMEDCNKKRDDSSSDFDAQFDECLNKFKKLK